MRVRAVNGDGGGPWARDTGTPEDNRPVASWAAASAEFGEGTDGAVTAVLNATPDRNLDVMLTWIETAADGSERVLAQSPLTFTAAGGARVSVPVTSEANTDNDADETYAIRMSVESAYAPYLKPGAPAKIVITIQDDDLPAAPTLTLTPGGGGLTASWTKPPGPVTGYEMRYREVGAGNDPAIGGDPSTGWVTVEPEGTGTSVFVGNLTAGSEYDARVRANDGQTAFGDGWGDWSDTVTDSPDREADSFAAPSALRVVRGDKALDLSWTPPPALDGDGGFGTNPTGYDVHYTSAASGAAADDADVQAGASPDPAVGWVAVLRSGDGAAQVLDGLTNATAYRVRVRATNDQQDILGAWVTGTGTPLSSDSTLSALIVSTGSDGVLAVRELRDPATGAVTRFRAVVTGYQVLAGPPDDKAWVQVRVGSSVSSVTVQGKALAPGTQSQGIDLAYGRGNVVTLRVTAQDGGVQEYRLRVVRPLPALTGLEVTAGDAQLDLAWDALSGTVAGHDVQYTSASKTGADAVADAAGASGADPAGGWVASTVGTAPPHTITGLDNGTAYRVRVRARNAGAVGPWAFADPATPLSSDATLTALEVVTSADGMADSPALTLSPRFSASAGTRFITPSYVIASHAKVKVKFTRAASGARVAVGVAPTSEKDTAPSSFRQIGSEASEAVLDLPHGFSHLWVRVSASDGTATTDYRIFLQRQIGMGFEGDALTVAEGAGNAQPRVETGIALTDSPERFATATVPVKLLYAAGATDPASLADDLGARPESFTTVAGERVSTIDIPVTDDAENERDETFTVSLVDSFTLDINAIELTDDADSVTITIEDNDPPAAPAGLALTPGMEKITAAWTKPAGPVTGYALRYRVLGAAEAPATTPGDPGTGWVTLEPMGTATTAEITGLTMGTGYQVQVRATDGQAAQGNGYGDWSAARNAAPEGPPAAPSDLSVEARDGLSGTLDLSWTAPGGTVTRYDVHYTSLANAANDAAVQSGGEPLAADGWVAADRGTVSDPPAVKQAITGLANDRPHRVRVRAVNAHGSGAWAVASAQPTDTRGVASLSAATGRVAEGGTLLLAVGLDKAAEQLLPVLLNPADGTAVAADYTVGTDAVQFRGDVVSQAFTVTGTDDDVNEEDETFSVALGIEAPHDERFRTGSPAEVEVTIADNDPPVAPGGLSVTDGQGELTASWTAPVGPVTGYAIRYRTAAAPEADAKTAGDPSTGWVTQAVNGTDTQATITGLANGTQYVVQVRATDGQAPPGNGWGPWSASQTGNVLARPGAVRDLEAAPGDAQVRLDWDDPAAGTVTGFDIHYTSADAATAADDAAASGADPAAGWVAAAENLGSGSGSHVVRSLTNDLDHRFRVRARNSAGPGPWAVVTARPGPYPYSLDLAAEAGDGEVDLSWSVQDGDGASVHHIDYTSAPETGAGAVADDATASGNDASTGWVRETGDANPEHTIDDLDNGTLYRFRVRGVNTADGGPWAFAEAKPLSSVATLSALTARTGDGVADPEVSGDDGLAAQTLSPAFASSVTSYRTTTLPVSHDMARITATATDSGATLMVGKKGGTLAEVTSGVEGAAIELDSIKTEMTVRVLAQDHSDDDPNFTDYTVAFSRPAVVGFGQSAIEIAEGATAKPTLVGSPGRAVHVLLDYTVVSPSSLNLNTALVSPPASAVTDMSAASPVPVVSAADDTANEPDEVFSITLRLQTGLSSGVVLDEDAKTVTVTIKDNDPPAAPALTLTPGMEKLTATWTRPAGPLEGYRMRIRPKDGSWGSDLVVGESDTSREITKDSVGVNLTAGNGVVYEVWLRATDGQTGAGNGFGDWAKASASPEGPPTSPMNLEATPGARWLDLTWMAPPGPVTGYDVYYTTNGLKRLQDLNCYRNPAATNCASVTPFELAAPVDPSNGWVDAEHAGTDAAHRIDGLDYGSTYHVMVRAINESGTGAPALEHSTLPDTRRTVSFGADSATIREGQSATLTATLDATPGRYLAAGLAYADGTATEVLDYKADAATVEFFKDTENLDLSVVVGSVFDTLNEADETFTVTLDVGSVYEPHLKAVAPAEVTVTITDDDPPAAPADLALKPGVSELTATWTKPDGPVTGYQLRYKTADAPDADATTPGDDPSTGWVTLAATGTDTQGTITGMSNGTEYAVQVRATDGQAAPGNGWGAWSASEAETPLARPGAVSDLVAAPGTGPGTLEVRWTAATGVVTGHDVHYTSASADAASDGAAASGSDAGAGWVAWTGSCAPDGCAGQRPGCEHDVPGAGAGLQRCRPGQLGPRHGHDRRAARACALESGGGGRRRADRPVLERETGRARGTPARSGWNTPRPRRWARAP